MATKALLVTVTLAAFSLANAVENPTAFVVSEYGDGVPRDIVQKYEAIRNKEEERAKAVLSPTSSQFMRASVSKPSEEATWLAEKADFFEFLHYELKDQERRERTASASARRRSPRSALAPQNSTLGPAPQFNHGAAGSHAICADEQAETDCESPSLLRYRTFSGRCNNLAHPNYGRRTVRLRRLLRAEYDDDFASPKTRGVPSDNRLPNPRAVSAAVHADDAEGLSDARHTLMLMQWGQFLDHDVTLTPMIRGRNNTVLDCSSCNSRAVHRACDPIPVPENDDFFSTRRRRSGDGEEQACIPFTRSLPGQQSRSRRREQLNENTAWVDASHLYGSSPCRARQLRTFAGGRMKATRHPGSWVFKDLMPRSGDNPECVSPLRLCFHTGDDRNNEQPGLTSMHTLLLREHNRIADQMAAVNQHWDDERLFQEARKVVMAINQHITFSEFLPRVLGPDYTADFGLSLLPAGHSAPYDESANPDIHNAFATAAFRFGHSLIKPMFHLMSQGMRRVDDIRLRNHFNNPDVVFSTHFIDQIVRGLISTPMANFDAGITSELTNHLFEEVGRPHSGMDLAALNIKRGRDHGLPGYTKYVRICRRAVSRGSVDEEIVRFDQLLAFMDVEAVEKLAKVYNHVQDVDLFSGGLSERPVRGGIVGPTFACLIANQFRTIKSGDRFWYETADESVGFTEVQLAQIRRVTLASLVCKNCDVGTPVQRQVFDTAGGDNPMLPCSESNHASVDVASHWRDETRQSKQIEADATTRPYCDFFGRVGSPGGEEVRVSACTECRCLPSGVGDCRTIRVQSCTDLFADVGREAVKVDRTCAGQCA